MYGLPVPTCVFVLWGWFLDWWCWIIQLFLWSCHVAAIQVIINLHYFDTNVPYVLQDHRGHMQIHLFSWKQMFCQWSCFQVSDQHVSVSTGILKLLTFRQQQISETENRNNFEFSDSSREGNLVNLFVKTVVPTVCLNSFLYTFLTVVEDSFPIIH